ncbi:hypothetical protein BH10PSE2_BH10PSE2_14750 [soil metagenome]
MTNRLNVLRFAGVALALAALPAAALAQATTDDGASATMRESDAGLTCRQMADEAATLSQDLDGHQGSGVFHTLGGVARSGAALLIPGAGLAMAGADAATQGSRDRREARADNKENRWYYLNGLYAGKGCQQQAESADHAASSSPGVTPAAPGQPKP